MPRSRSSANVASTASPSGALEQRLPGGVLGDLGAQLLARGQRLRERGEHAPADPRRHRVEVAPGVVRGGVRAHEQPGAVRPRRVGGDPAPAQLDVEAEIARDRPRQQRDEVGVARQARVDAGPGALGDGRAARVLAPLEHEHGAPGAGEVGGGDEPVVAAADDHGVVARHADGPRYSASAEG